MEIIKAQNLTKKFGDFVAVNDVDFSVQKGEIFAFLGPNGAGKTTVIRMLTTVLNPTAGKIFINGKDISQNENAARCSFGVVFQDHSLDEDLTAYENMELHGAIYGMENKLARQRTEFMLKLVELWDKKDILVKRFSGGMKRRLEIARGLLHQPEIFFLDEPTLGLDPQTRNKIWDYLKELNQTEKITIFFSTHYMQEVERVATKIAVIDEGKIIVIGSLDEIKKQSNAQTLEDAFLNLTGRDIREENTKGFRGFKGFRH